MKQEELKKFIKRVLTKDTSFGSYEPYDPTTDQYADFFTSQLTDLIDSLSTSTEQANEVSERYSCKGCIYNGTTNDDPCGDCGSEYKNKTVAMISEFKPIEPVKDCKYENQGIETCIDCPTSEHCYPVEPVKEVGVDAEYWLNENCKPKDWSEQAGQVTDYLHTPEVLGYMEGYANYLLQSQPSMPSDEEIKQFLSECLDIDIRFIDDYRSQFNLVKEFAKWLRGQVIEPETKEG